MVFDDRSGRAAILGPRPGRNLPPITGGPLASPRSAVYSFDSSHVVAGVAELADAQDSGSCGRKVVEVRLLSPALSFPGSIDLGRGGTATVPRFGPRSPYWWCTGALVERTRSHGCGSPIAVSDILDPGEPNASAASNSCGSAVKSKPPVTNGPRLTHPMRRISRRKLDSIRMPPTIIRLRPDHGRLTAMPPSSSPPIDWGRPPRRLSRWLR